MIQHLELNQAYHQHAREKKCQGHSNGNARPQQRRLAGKIF
jgi:hypothetical protein